MREVTYSRDVARRARRTSRASSLRWSTRRRRAVGEKGLQINRRDEYCVKSACEKNVPLNENSTGRESPAKRLIRRLDRLNLQEHVLVASRSRPGRLSRYGKLPEQGRGQRPLGFALLIEKLTIQTLNDKPESPRGMLTRPYSVRVAGKIFGPVMKMND